MLQLMDRAALIDKECSVTPLPAGGFQGKDGLLPRFAYQTKDFSGFAWRPLQSEFVLVKRPVWIVEGVPKDKYYLYGKIALRFDKETWRGTYNSKYDWQGQILNSYMPVFGPFFDVAASGAAPRNRASRWRRTGSSIAPRSALPIRRHRTQQSRITFPKVSSTWISSTARGNKRSLSPRERGARRIRGSIHSPLLLSVVVNLF
jgi:hypothetical protein